MDNETTTPHATLLTFIIISNIESKGANFPQITSILQKRLFNREYECFALCANKIIAKINTYHPLTGRIILRGAKELAPEISGISTDKLEDIFDDLIREKIIPKWILDKIRAKEKETPQTDGRALLRTLSDIQGAILYFGDIKTFEKVQQGKGKINVLEKSIVRKDGTTTTLSIPEKVAQKYLNSARKTLLTASRYSPPILQRLLFYCDDLNLKQNGTKRMGSSTIERSTYISFSLADFGRILNLSWANLNPDTEENKTKIHNGKMYLREEIMTALDILRRAEFAHKFKNVESVLGETVYGGRYFGDYVYENETFFISYGAAYNIILAHSKLYTLPYQYFQIEVESTSKQGALRMLIMDKLSEQLTRGLVRNKNGEITILTSTLLTATALPKKPQECNENKWNRYIVTPIEETLKYCVERGVLLNWRYEKEYKKWDEWIDNKIIYNANPDSYVNATYYPSKKPLPDYFGTVRREIKTPPKNALLDEPKTAPQQGSLF